MFLTVLTKIGNENELTEEVIEYLEARSIEMEKIERWHLETVRLFYLNSQLDEYHHRVFSSTDNRKAFTANDTYTRYKTKVQLTSTRSIVYKLKSQETGKLPCFIGLVRRKPYMVLQNIDVIDKLVNGAIGTLEYIEGYTDSSRIKRLWLRENRQITTCESGRSLYRSSRDRQTLDADKTLRIVDTFIEQVCFRETVASPSGFGVRNNDSQ